MAAVFPVQASGEAPPVRSRPGWLVAVWIATLLYLIVELSFNARLLDVVGGNASMQEVDRIEVWGRLISGFALALLGWPLWIRQAWSRHSGTFRRVWHVAMWSMLAMLAMYVVQESVLRWLVNKAGTDELLQAQHLVLLRSGLHAGDVDIPGLEAADGQLATAEGKAFLSMFPMLASGLGDVIDDRFDAAKREYVTRRLVRKRMGEPNLHLDGYSQLVTGILEGYQRYGEALGEVDSKGNEAWNEYVRRLRDQGHSPGSVPSKGHARVRREVRGLGVPVANNWNPRDRAGFHEAATRSGRQLARSEFARELGAKEAAFIGIRLPETYDLFMRDADMQRRMLSVLGYACLRTFDPDIGASSAAFMRNLYDAEVACLTSEALAAEGELKAGRDAMRALLVPIIALALSLLGALAHIGKLGFLTTKLVLGRAPANARLVFSGIMAAPVVLLLLFAWIPVGQITTKPLYRDLESDLSRPLALVMRGTIHGQHLGYPFFDAVRVRVMRGFTFGYRGDEGVEPAAGGEDAPAGEPQGAS